MLKIMRDGFTIEVYGPIKTYASDRFFISLYGGAENIAELEKDLLRWAFAGKPLPFEVGEDDFISYKRQMRTLFIDRGGRKKTFRYLRINGEEFRVIKDYIKNEYVIMGEVPVYLSADDETGRVHSFRASSDEFDLDIVLGKNHEVPGFIMEFLKERRAGVLKKYIPMGNGLKVVVRSVMEKTHVQFTYGEYSKVAHLVLEDDELVGPAAFRNGFVVLRVPFDELRNLGENFRFGFVPEEYVEEWILRYPPLRKNVVVKVTSTAWRILVENNRCFVEFIDGLSYIMCQGKKKSRKSTTVFKKYLREAGMLE